MRFPLPFPCENRFATELDGDEIFFGNKKTKYTGGEVHQHFELIRKITDDYKAPCERIDEVTIVEANGTVGGNRSVVGMDVDVQGADDADYEEITYVSTRRSAPAATAPDWKTAPKDPNPFANYATANTTPPRNNCTLNPVASGVATPPRPQRPQQSLPPFMSPVQPPPAGPTPKNDDHIDEAEVLDEPTVVEDPTVGGASRRRSVKRRATAQDSGSVASSVASHGHVETVGGVDADVDDDGDEESVNSDPFGDYDDE